MEITKINWNIALITDDKIQIIFKNCNIDLDGMAVDFPWEYEKSGIYVTTKEIWDCLVFDLKVEWKNVAYVDVDKIEKSEDVVNFFWDIDILIIIWNKENAKITESLEAKVIVPYGEWKSIFLTTLGQTLEPVTKYKFKEWDFYWENIVFINLD